MQTLALPARAGQINLDERGSAWGSHSWCEQITSFIKDVREERQILSYQPWQISVRARNYVGLPPWSISHKTILQLMPDENMFLYFGFWHDERWSLNYETGSFNLAAPLPIRCCKALSHLIRFDSSPVSRCLLLDAFGVIGQGERGINGVFGQEQRQTPSLKREWEKWFVW